MHRIQATSVIVLLTLVFSSAYAQDNPIQASRPSVAQPECVTYRSLRPKNVSAARARDRAWAATVAGELMACIDDFEMQLKNVTTRAALIATGSPTEPATPEAARLVEQQEHRLLASDYLAYQNLIDWWRTLRAVLQRELVRPSGSGPGSSALSRSFATLQDKFEIIDDDVARRMDSHGLAQPFAAELASGLGFQSAGASSNLTQTAAGQDSNSSSPIVHVVWESRHFGSNRRSPIELSFAGRFGFQPALTLVAPVSGGGAASTSAAEPDPAQTRASYQEAFGWSTGTRISFPFAKYWEISAVPRLGQMVLTDDATLIRDQGPAFIAIPINNNASNAELFWEYAGEINLFGQPHDLVHLTKGVLTPLLNITAGMRHDARFKKEGQLVAFDNPERRFFFKFLISGLMVTRTAATGTNETFSLSFGVEHERPWSGEQGAVIPAGTRLLIRGDVNLLQALRGNR